MNRKILIIISVLVLGIAATAIGVYNSFLAGKGYVETTAVIDHIDEIERGYDEDNVMQYDYDVYVNYSVDGKEYTGKSDYYSGSYKEGMEIKISYDPNDPTKIHGDSKGMGIILMIAGSVTIVVCVVLLIAAGMVKRN
ncbi:MAG: hypothetical protein IJ232_11650 [Lachnospiraceae bacterium]|nr:hypothetical protein [Lachnospiraceae bacterium]